MLEFQPNPLSVPYPEENDMGFNFIQLQTLWYMLLAFAVIFLSGISVFDYQRTIFLIVIESVNTLLHETGIINSGLSGYWTRLAQGLVIGLCVSVYAGASKTKSYMKPSD